MSPIMTGRGGMGSGFAMTLDEGAAGPEAHKRAHQGAMVGALFPYCVSWRVGRDELVFWSRPDSEIRQWAATRGGGQRRPIKARHRRVFFPRVERLLCSK